jgi:hypothetical protein
MALLLEDIRDPELRAIAGRHAEAREKAIAEQLRAAQRLGQISPCEPDVLARVLYAGWNGAMIQWALRDRGSVVKWVGDALDAVVSPYLPARGSILSPAKVTRRARSGAG